MELTTGTDWVGEDGSWSFTRFPLPSCYRCSLFIGVTDIRGNEVVKPLHMKLSPDGNSATCSGCNRTLYKQPSDQNLTA